MNNHPRRHALPSLPVLLFFLYLFAMFYLLFIGWRSPGALQRGGSFFGSERVNLAPFSQFSMLWNGYRRGVLSLWYCLYNLLGNIAVFLPVGYYLPRCVSFVRRLWLFLPVSAVMILVIEAVQWLTGTGRFDIDDLILNLLGALIGYLVFRPLWRKRGASCSSK